MASTNTTSVPESTSGVSSPPRRGAYRGGGRGGQFRRPSAGESTGIPNERGEFRALRGDRGRARGRGPRGGGRGSRGGNPNATSDHSQPTAPLSNQDPTTTHPPPQPGGSGVFGGRLTKDAASNNTTTTGELKQGDAAAAGDDDGDAEVCFICANPVSHHSVAPCNHRTCHICALRLRALYKTKACAHCRSEAATVIFTDEAEKRYEDYATTDFFSKDGNLGIAYEKEDIFGDTVLLLRYNCPDGDCDVACMGWPDLHRHVRSVHHKVMCDLCTRNKKVFTHEHELFTHQELRNHEKVGDDNPGAIDQSGFKGHPECGFCRQRFYGDDELYAHCRDKHERCHLCDRRTGGTHPQYFINYEALERHFNRDHQPCLDPECLEKKFVVFDSELDLKAHQLEQHPNGMSKDVRRDARRVDISNFDYRPQYQETRRGGGGAGGGRRGGGRGRDPNSEPMPATSGGQMSRAEMAHQREREIHSAQSVTTRTFGGQLSQQDPQAQTVHRPANMQSPRPANAQPTNSALHDRPPITNTDQRPAEQLTPQEQARRLRHAAVTERASNLLHNDAIKLAEFRSRITSYRTDSITASNLIDAFFSLFDTSSTELGKLVKELADIFEVAGKRDALLKAWADWKAINEDYPTLPALSGAGPSTSAGMLGAGSGGNRVLRLKSATAVSAKAKGQQQQQKNWGAAAAAAGVGSSSRSTNSPAFPSLPSAAPATQQQPSGWLTLRPSATASASSSAKPSPTPSRVQSSVNLGGGGKRADSAFPALPAAKKPTSTVFSPGYMGAGVLRQNNGGATGSAWGAAQNGGGASGGGGGGAVPEASEEPQGSGKGKGRKKQIMFQWG